MLKNNFKKIPLELPEKNRVYFLFSYDYFYALHPFYKEFLKIKKLIIIHSNY